MVGFSIDEIMTGTHKFQLPLLKSIHGERDHTLSFDVTWGHESVSKYLNYKSDEFMLASLEGYVTVGGLCVMAPCCGTFKLDYFGEHKITYDFYFRDQNRKDEYRLHGEKVNIKPWNLPTSHTTCFCTITNEDDVLISKGVVFFQWRTLPGFLLSFKLR